MKYTVGQLKHLYKKSMKKSKRKKLNFVQNAYLQNKSFVI